MKIYQCDRGLIYIMDDDVAVTVFANARLEAGAGTGIWIAYCECFQVVGQADTPDGAMRSLEEVLSEHLSYYLSNGVLEKMLDTRIWRQISSTSIDFSTISSHLTRLRKMSPFVVQAELRFEEAV